MGWRVVYISNPAYLSLKNTNLLIDQKELSEKVSIDLEDISVIVLESRQATITTSLLSSIAKEKIALFICDEYHHPNGLFLPFSQHSRFSKIAHIQKDISKPLKNKLWQKIIQTKVLNQAKALKVCQQDGYKKLKTLSQKVQSNDKTYIESYAASEYFAYMFEDINRRDSMDSRNGALNYGYAIIRGAISRTLSAYGFIPAFGIQHCSELNSFNLSDDLIEAFRVFVDVEVIKIYEDCAAEDIFLTKKQKAQLINLLTIYIEIDGEKLSVLNAIEKMVQTLQKSYIENNYSLLKLPTFAKGYMI
jgi:CRISPR-associated protein Cas1